MREVWRTAWISSIALALFGGSLLRAAGGEGNAVPVLLTELLAHPETYSSKLIRVQGVWGSAFEYSALYPAGFQQKYATAIWVRMSEDPEGNGGIWNKVQRVQEKRNDVIATVELTCDLEGIFHYDAKRRRGHMNSFNSELIVSRVYSAVELNQ